MFEVVADDDDDDDDVEVDDSVVDDNSEDSEVEPEGIPSEATQNTSSLYSLLATTCAYTLMKKEVSPFLPSTLAIFGL